MSLKINSGTRTLAQHASLDNNQLFKLSMKISDENSHFYTENERVRVYLWRSGERGVNH